MQPPLLMNMNVMLAAVFDERQYGAALEILSDTLRFLQSTPSFRVDATPEDAFEVHVGLGDTMTADDILEGIMRITVLVAVAHPAEFIGITFQQQMQKS